VITAGCAGGEAAGAAWEEAATRALTKTKPEGTPKKKARATSPGPCRYVPSHLGTLSHLRTDYDFIIKRIQPRLFPKADVADHSNCRLSG